MSTLDRLRDIVKPRSSVPVVEDDARLESDRFSGRYNVAANSATAKAVALQTAVGIVLAAEGYPGDIRTGDVIHGLDDVARDCPDVQIFYAGVKQRGDDLVTAGGRVLTVMAMAPTFAIAIARAYEAASKIHFDGMQYRRDIGRKALLVP
jgi:phosphoribosylamine-glycine ligase